MREKELCVREPRWVQITALLVDVLGASAITLLTGALAAKAFYPSLYYNTLKFFGL